MAGVGAAFLFVPLAEATPTALLLNVVSLMLAVTTYWRGKLINWSECSPKNKRVNRTLIANESWKACVYSMLRLHEIKAGHVKSKLWRINNYGY